MTVNHINLTRLASCALLAAFLIAGISATPALAQEYKEAHHAAGRDCAHRGICG